MCLFVHVCPDDFLRGPLKDTGDAFTQVEYTLAALLAFDIALRLLISDGYFTFLLNFFTFTDLAAFISVAYSSIVMYQWGVRVACASQCEFDIVCCCPHVCFSGELSLTLRHVSGIWRVSFPPAPERAEVNRQDIARKRTIRCQRPGAQPRKTENEEQGECRPLMMYLFTPAHCVCVSSQTLGFILLISRILLYILCSAAIMMWFELPCSL